MLSYLKQRTLWLVLVALGCGSADQAPTAEPTYRAFKKLAGATGMGVNKPTYDALLREAATELLILGDLAPGTPDTSTLRLYLSALDKYKDAGSLWTDQVDDARYDWIPKGRILASDQSIAERYKLETTDHKMPYTGTSFKSVSSESIQLIWARAKLDVDSADDAVVQKLKKLRH